MADGFATSDAGTSTSADAATPADREAVVKLGESLEQFAAAAAEQHEIERIIERELAGGVGPRTMDNLLASIAAYSSDDLSEPLLLAILRAGTEPDYQALLDASLPDAARRWVRLLRALYGESIQDAYTVMRRPPTGWKEVSREVYSELLSGEWRVDFDVITFSGDRHHYEETPTSLLGLAEAIVDTLVALPPHAAPEAIEPARLATFKEACGQLFNLVTRDVAAVPLTPVEPGTSDQGSS